MDKHRITIEDKQAIKIIHDIMHGKGFAVNNPMAWDILFNAFWHLEYGKKIGNSVANWWNSQEGTTK